MRSVLALCAVLLLMAAGFLLLRGHEGPGVGPDDRWELGEDEAPPTPGDLRTEPSPPGPDDARASHGAGRSGRPLARAFAGVRGVVEDEAGRPLPGVSVRLDTLDASELRGAVARAGETLSTASTDGGGAFELALESHRWVRVTASLPGYATVGTRVAGPGAFVRLVLPAAASLEVEVVDGRDDAVPGAAVRALAREAVLVRETDSTGRARFDDLPPGVVTVEVRAAGGRRARTLPLAVASGAEARRVVVLLPDAVSVTGLVLETGTLLPVEGAEVHAAQPGLAFAAEPTGPDGAFGPVAAGGAGERILLAVRAPGYAPQMVPVLLTRGEAVQRLPPVEMQPAADWRGRVVDALNRPVPNARVAYTGAGITGRAPPGTRTDEAGRFTLPPPSPPAPGRRVVLTAEAASGAAALALRPGDPPPADLVLVLAGGWTVSGRVVAAGGAPLSGASVRLEPRWSAIADRGRPGPETSRLLALGDTARLALATATDAAGRWGVDGVPDGTYDVRVLHGGATAFPDEPLVVAGADVDAGDVRLGDGHAVEGTVRDASGGPLAGVEMVLRETAASPRLRRAYADAEGRWRLEGVPAGAWLLFARAGLMEVRRLELEVPTQDPIDVVLDPRGRLTGRVVDAAGRPYEGVFRVRLEGETPETQWPERAFRDPQGGRFDLDGVWAGTWTVRVETPDGGIGTSPAPVTLRPGQTFDVTVTLGAGAVVSGTLRAPDGRGLGGGRITVTHEARRTTRSVTTTSDGAFRATGLDAGPYRIVARGRGGAAVVETVDLASGEQRELDLTLGAVSSVEVTVRGADGEARAGAYVLVRPAGSPTARPESVPRTDREGRVVLEDVPLGAVEIQARMRDGEAGRIEVVVTRDAPRTVEIVVSRPARPAGD